MARSKKKIKIVNPARLIVAVTGLLALIILLVSLIGGMFGGDKIQKQIEKKEGADVAITDKRFSSNLPDGSTVHLGDVVTFKLTYCYQIEDGTLKAYEVTEGVTVKIEGETEDEPSTVGKVTDNTVQILQTAKMNDTLIVTISHKYMEDVTYEYTVGSSEVIE